MVLQQETVPMREGYDIGIGVAMATGSPMALGAIGEVTPPQIGTGGSGSFTFNRIDTTQDLETELGIEAEVSAGIGLFGASASFDFSKKCKIQSSSLTVLVSAEERFAFQQMDSPELSPGAGDAQENGKNLSDQFGEYFVRGMRTGGRFVGVIRIDTQSVQSKTDVNAALSASYGLTVSAEVRTKIRTAMSSANAFVEARVIHDGGRVSTHPTSNDPVQALEQLYKAMDEWTDTVRDEPKAYAVTLAPYIIALGPLPPNIADIEHQRDVLIRCAKLRSQTLDKLNLIDYMLDPDHMNEFEIIPPPEGPDLPALQAALAGDLDVIADAASFAINNVKEAKDPVTFMREIKGITDFELTALPTNLPKHTGSQPALPTIRVPNMVGINGFEMEGALRCLSAGSVDDCFAGTVFGTPDDPDGPIPVSREVAEFLITAINTDLRLTDQFLPVDVMPEFPFDVVNATFPPAGTLVSTDSEVIIQWRTESAE